MSELQSSAKFWTDKQKKKKKTGKNVGQKFERTSTKSLHFSLAGAGGEVQNSSTCQLTWLKKTLVSNILIFYLVLESGGYLHTTFIYATTTYYCLLQVTPIFMKVCTLKYSGYRFRKFEKLFPVSRFLYACAKTKAPLSSFHPLQKNIASTFSWDTRA